VKIGSAAASQCLHTSRHWQWCSRDHNLRDRDLVKTSRPRPRVH